MRKIHRQLQIYYHIINTEYHSPKDLMREFGMGQRTLQRDLEDLRHCGLLYLKYNRKKDNYLEADPRKFKKPVKLLSLDVLVSFHMVQFMFAGIVIKIIMIKLNGEEHGLKMAAVL